MHEALLATYDLFSFVDHLCLLDGGGGLAGKWQEILELFLGYRGAGEQVIDGDEADGLPLNGKGEYGVIRHPVDIVGGVVLVRSLWIVVEDVARPVFAVHFPTVSFYVGDGKILVADVFFATAGIGTPGTAHHSSGGIV